MPLRRRSESTAALARFFVKSVLTEGPLRALRRVRAYRQGVREDQDGVVPGPETRKHCVFVSGCRGATRRYRAAHAAEALEHAGRTCDVVHRSALRLETLAPCYDVFVLQRVPFDHEVGALRDAARGADKLVLADVDDLLIHESYRGELRHVEPGLDREIAVEHMAAISRTLECVDGVLVSTDALADEVRRTFPGKPVAVLRNAVSREMVELAVAPVQHEGFVLAYLSGTATHARDLASIEHALVRVLSERSDARLLLVGAIDVPRGLTAFGDRVEKRDLLDWRALPALLAGVDVNLVPLEGGSRYTAAKSEIKFFEAALASCPTVASRIGAYESAIRDGETGFLCATTADWVATMCRLADSPELGRRVAAAARSHVESEHTTGIRGARLVEILDEMRVAVQ